MTRATSRTIARVTTSSGCQPGTTPDPARSSFGRMPLSFWIMLIYRTRSQSTVPPMPIPTHIVVIP